MNILRISKPQKWRKFKKNDPRQSLLGLTKKIVYLLLILNSKFYYQ